MEVDLDPSLDGIEGQGRRSRSNMKIMFFSLLIEKEVKVRREGQRSRSKSKVIGQGHCQERKSELKVGMVKVKSQGHRSRSHDQGHYYKRSIYLTVCM